MRSWRGRRLARTDKNRFDGLYRDRPSLASWDALKAGLAARRDTISVVLTFPVSSDLAAHMPTERLSGSRALPEGVREMNGAGERHQEARRQKLCEKAFQPNGPAAVDGGRFSSAFDSTDSMMRLETR